MTGEHRDAGLAADGAPLDREAVTERLALPPVMGPELLAGRATMKLAIAALESSLSEGWPQAEPPRQLLRPPIGQLLLMPSWNDTGLGVKLTTVRTHQNGAALPRIQGLFVLFRLPEMIPTLAVDAAALTALRTPAVSAVATKYLAPPSAHRLVVFGTGPQAAGHVLAVSCVRQLSFVGIVGHTPDKAEALAADLRRQGFPARAAGPDAVAEADMVCTCTSSRTPVYDGVRLLPPVHINAVGTHEPGARELDDVTFRDAVVVVESHDAALREAGDIIMARASGALSPNVALHELGAVVRGEAPIAGARQTIFKSVGTSGQDLVVGQMLLQRLIALGHRQPSGGSAAWLLGTSHR
ncbi:MAG TPA: ornithine cyclodeaminase family protein [Candidatus Dormibacteraeota bacterium]|nr:ornithine cyclodeaminase family protein [Candidatus Dormibacteraeota bacterium]